MDISSVKKSCMMEQYDFSAQMEKIIEYLVSVREGMIV